MKTKELSLKVSALLSTVLLFASCSQEVLESVTEKNNDKGTEVVDVTQIRATMSNFKLETMGDEPSTRTTIASSGDDFQIVWHEKDTIGIFPSVGTQVAFPMASNAGTQNATFDGGGWGLKSSATYSAYYPLIGQFYLDRTKIPMIISQQVQDGNGSFEHIGNNDYMAAVNAIVNQSGGVEFNFEHLVSILHMEIKMPKCGNYSYVAIETSARFTTEATINLSTGTVTPTKQSPIQIMKLENVTLDDGDGDHVLELWIAIHPVDLTGYMLYTKIFDEDNNCYTTTMQAKNFEAGTIYNSRKIATEDLTHTGLPVVIINTPNNQNITSKEVYVENTLMTILQTDITDEFCEIMNMKGRGNSTWSAPKKPYAIKFNKKQSLLSLPEDKQWVLLANYYDPTLLDNSVAFYMGNEMSTLDWTPHYQHVDLMLNGEYKGIYQLGEKVKISKGRVNVGDDGFLMEIDQRALNEDDARYFTVSHLLNPINIKEPDVDYDDEDFNYARDYVTAAEDALYSSSFMDAEVGWQRYMDMNSFVEWYLINEITYNSDCCNLYSSCYMSLKRGGKLKMGPIWDFDLGFNYYGLGSNPHDLPSTGFHLKSRQWFGRLFQDPSFVANVKSRFNYYFNNRQQIYDFIDTKALLIKSKIYEENNLWETNCSASATTEEVQAAYQEKVDALKIWLEDRFQWLNTQFSAL